MFFGFSFNLPCHGVALSFKSDKEESFSAAADDPDCLSSECFQH